MSAAMETAVILAGAPGLILSSAHAWRMLRAPARPPRSAPAGSAPAGRAWLPWAEPAGPPPGEVPPEGESMPRADAARSLGVTDRTARGLVQLGLLEQCPYRGGPATVTTESVNALLALRNREAAS